MKFFTTLLFLAVCFFNSTMAQAYDVSAQFVIDKLWISGAETGHYRIVDEGGPAQCTGGPAYPGWSYINVSDSGSKGKIAAILLAYAQGKTVELTTETDGNGYCHIVEFWVY